MDIRRIQRILPHRYPMLLVDRVVEIVGDQQAIGIKNVTFNDIFFQGHYPGTPIMPGVLIVEAMAQLGGILLSQKLEHTGKLAVLLSMDKVKMRHPVVPGDQLILEAVAVRVKSRTGHVRCKALCKIKWPPKPILSSCWSTPSRFDAKTRCSREHGGERAHRREHAGRRVANS